LLLLPPLSQAQLIFLKDGTAINGKVRKESTSVYDPLAGESYTYTSAYHVDDGPRRYYFAPTQMHRIDDAVVRAEDTVASPMRFAPTPTKGHPGGIAEVLEAPPWNEKWNRNFRFLGIRDGKPWTLQQHLYAINSHYAFSVTLDKVNLSSYYLTQEL